MKAGLQTPSFTGPGFLGLRWSLRGFRDRRLHFTVEFIRPSFPHPRRPEETARSLIKWF